MKTTTSVLKVSTNIITCIIVRPIELAVILAIMPVSTFKSVGILNYVIVFYIYDDDNVNV